VILFIYRDESTTEQDKGIAEIIIGNGPIGSRPRVPR
jgi:hypothetical protein